MLHDRENLRYCVDLGIYTKNSVQVVQGYWVSAIGYAYVKKYPKHVANSYAEGAGWLARHWAKMDRKELGERLWKIVSSKYSKFYEPGASYSKSKRDKSLEQKIFVENFLNTVFGPSFAPAVDNQQPKL